MPRISLRDLFWLTLVVGLALGWWVAQRDGRAWKGRAETLAAFCERDAWQVKWKPGRGVQVFVPDRGHFELWDNDHIDEWD